MRARLAGHAWTIGPALVGPLRVRADPAERPITFAVADAHFGDVTLSGWWAPATTRRALALVVHGLGGSAESPYVHHAARAARAAGFATLRLNLRGADGDGADVYHAGLWQDLAAVLGDPRLGAATYDDVVVIGYSLGGHVATWLAATGAEPRLRGVAAVCAPLDLAASAAVIDAPRAFMYRHWVLRALTRAWARVDARGRGLADPAAVRRVRSLRAWDACVVVPRHGFASVEDYWARASVASQLGTLKVPTLYVGTAYDPMVPPHAVVPALAGADPRLHVRWLPRGGHVGYPADAWSGRSVEANAVAWLCDPSRDPAPA